MIFFGLFFELFIFYWFFNERPLSEVTVQAADYSMEEWFVYFYNACPLVKLPSHFNNNCIIWLFVANPLKFIFGLFFNERPLCTVAAQAADYSTEEWFVYFHNDCSLVKLPSHFNNSSIVWGFFCGNPKTPFWQDTAE